MSTHIYTFCGKYFIQLDGGPIGLRSTASLAALIMKMWDVAWLSLLENENIQIFEYFRYVDDSRDFLRPIAEGWRWTEDGFAYRQSWEEDDIKGGLTDQQRTTKELVAAKNSLIEYIQFEGEESSMFADDRLPTLDTALWVCEDTGKILYPFYEKPTCPDKMIQKETALNEANIRASLVQETVRRLKNCSEDLPIGEKQ